jgi:hypothetical protein
MSTDKNASEEEYFARLEREEKARAQAERAVSDARAAREALKAAHANRCGKCGGEMAPKGFRGVEIDLCGDCGAVLLDPGELETLAGNDESGALAGLAAFFRRK